MATEYTPIDSTPHRLHGWSRVAHFQQARRDDGVPLLLAELGHASPLYPLAFRAVGENRYQLVAVLGLHGEGNLFVDNHGKWLSPYIPSHYRAYPFTILAVQREEKTRFMLGFDHASGLYREAPDTSRQEQRFFDDAGQPLPWLQQMTLFLTECTKNRLETQRAVDALAAAKLIQPWPPTREADPARPPLPGFHGIDLAALNALSGAELETLRNANALYLAYAQILSIPRVKLLQQLYALRAKHTAQQPDLPSSLDALFGEGQPETLRFDGLFGK